MSNPTDFVLTPNGSYDFGEINTVMACAMRRQTGKIKLQVGVQHSNGTGYGLTHIEANHGKQIRSLGYPDVCCFVFDIANNIAQI
jgi:hypothetical protein